MNTKHRGFNKEPGNYTSFWESLMDMDITLKDGTKCKIKDNIKSVTFKETKKVTNEPIS